MLDPSGRPIKGAKVLLARNNPARSPRAETDADGQFRFSHMPAGETVLTVQALGFGPDLQKVMVSPGQSPVEFRLQKGRTIQGSVVNTKGEPLAGANVFVSGWRGQRTLDWRMTTDDEGIFRWEDAPPDSVWLDVWHEGYARVNHREVSAAGGELTVALNRQLKVRGIVVDARNAPRSPGVHPGAGDRAGRRLGDLLASRRRSAGQEGAVRDPVRRHDAPGGPPAAHRS